MAITVRQEQGAVPVTILSIYGKLDASNYLAAIACARQAYEQGAGDVLVDMRDVPFMSSSGIIALHTMVQIFHGEQSEDPQGGWEALRSLDRDPESESKKHVKLVHLQDRVARALEMTGLDMFFEIYDDFDQAMASFS